jgi:TetR/AcrR family transcriptional repressor of nem operon
MLGAELTSLGRRTAQQLQEFYRDNGLRLAKILREGRKSGALRFQGEPETLGMAVFSLLEGGMLVARADGGIKRFRQLSAQLLKLVGA